MIKILFFIEKFSYNGSIGGAEKVLITLVNNMDPGKYDITVQTVFPDPFAGLLKGHIHYKYCYKNKNRMTTLLYRAEAESGMIYRRCIKGDYDIETAFLEFDTTKVIAASTNKRAKKVAWVHCDLNIALRDKAGFVKKTEKRYKNYDQIVCVSEQCRRSFREIFGGRFDPVVLHNVIDVEEIKRKAAQPLPFKLQKCKTVLCSVGRFSYPKNHMRLLRACKRLRSEGYDFELWLVGDGMLRTEIENYIRDNGLEETVRLFGFQANPYPFMLAADLLVCSSDYEGYSTFITEGVILQKRILTTDCSGMHDILDKYSAGRIVANSDEAFFKGLVEYFQQPEEITGRIPDSTIFSTQQLVKENESFFESLVKNQSRNNQ